MSIILFTQDPATNDVYGYDADINQQALAVQRVAAGHVIFTPPATSSAQLLAQAQAVQLGVIEAAYQAANALPIPYMSTSFQADAVSQALIANVLGACGGSLPNGFQWFDVNNVGVTVTFAQLQGLAGSIMMRGQPLFSNKQAKKAAVRAAVTVAAVNAITF